jgi:NADH-quinone oxidoreductase subunit H
MNIFEFIRDPSQIGPWFNEVLLSTGMQPWLANLIGDVIGVLLVVIVVLTSAIFLIWLERKIAARLQDRLGPNRAGPYGLLQTMADIVKLLTKEDVTPEGADRVSFNLAPALMVMQIIMVAAIIPIGAGLIGANLSVGLLYFVAMSGIASIGALMAGWASNNKYALLGGFRVVAQLMSYEIPLAFSLLAVVVWAGTMGTNNLAIQQGELLFGFIPGWNILVMPFAALIFFIATLAEGERAPFDLLEAESEIVAGPNIEYSGLKFAWFYLQFFVNSLLLACIFATVFLGGWQGPFVDQFPALGIGYFFAKSLLVLLALMWVRATYPRLRIDQMMTFCWKVLVPVTIVVVLIVAIGAGSPRTAALTPPSSASLTSSPCLSPWALSAGPCAATSNAARPPCPADPPLRSNDRASLVRSTHGNYLYSRRLSGPCRLHAAVRPGCGDQPQPVSLGDLADRRLCRRGGPLLAAGGRILGHRPGPDLHRRHRDADRLRNHAQSRHDDRPHTHEQFPGRHLGSGYATALRAAVFHSAASQLAGVRSSRLGRPYPNDR